MPVHALGKHFDYFFGQLNPAPSFAQRAASEHHSIIHLIENALGPAASLSPKCFLQGSYSRQTAIYAINDVDIVALCNLRPSLGLIWTKEQPWRRNELFETIAAPLRTDSHYKDKVLYGNNSMCIKVDLGIKVEILPVIYGSWFSNANSEPFLLYRPEAGRWEGGYARFHQQRLSGKNVQERTGGNFIPAIKVMKHIRSYHELNVVSFHLECLLYSLPDRLFQSSAPTFIAAILHAIASESAETWYHWKSVKTPCRERNLFCTTEWSWESWKAFHAQMVSFDLLAQAACSEPNKAMAIQMWQLLLGKGMFATEVSA